MARLEWDKTGERVYETGIDQGVLYLLDENAAYTKGVEWNGIISVSESPSGAEPTALWADNIKYVNLMSSEEFGATVEAYYYPDEFAECDGSVEVAPGVTIAQQDRKPFGLCYRTKVGNDVNGGNHGYKLHLIYGALAEPSEKTFSTINDSPEAITFSWGITTTPVNVTGHKATSVLTIDSTKVDATALANLEDILYGNDEADARLPLPDEVAEIFKAA